MRKYGTIGGLTALATVMLIGQLNIEGHASTELGTGGDSIGPDIAVCQMGSTQSWGRVGDIHAFSIQTDSFNAGDETLLWDNSISMHPVIAQNLYRYRDGRIEMIGMSWLKHGFCALQFGGCGTCNGPSGCPTFLEPGCRDPYSATLNGVQGGLGPRSEVNASISGVQYPYELNWQLTGDAIFKRLQVHDDDLNPALNQGASFYIEGHYVHPQEGSSDRRHNNATYEKVNPSPAGNSYNLGAGTGTSNLQPAIFAWLEHEPEVVIEVVDIPGTPVDGRFHVGYHVYDNGDGTWRYEYAVHNMNSHRSGQAFEIPLGPGVDVLDTYYSDVFYHSGEPYSNEPWEMTVSQDSIRWAGETYDENTNANALRWSTLYNFSVTTNTPPMMGEVELALFRPGTPDSVTIPVLVPTPIDEPTCTGDLDGTGTVNVLDLLLLLENWGRCEGCDADLDGSGTVNVFDLLLLLENWGDCD